MKYQRFFYLILCVMIAGLLSSCDPSSYPYLSANRIVIVDNVPYINMSENTSWGPGCCMLIENHYFFSQDDGKTWEITSSAPVEMPEPIEDPTTINLQICVPNNENICYRISGKEEVEISLNSGKTWRVDWKMPSGRKMFMERHPTITHFVGVVPDTVPFDFGIIPKGESHVIIVALGNQGVLVKSSNDVWERYAVPSTGDSPMLAEPIPFYTTNLKDISEILRPERTWLFLFSCSYFVYLSLSTKRKIGSNALLISFGYPLAFGFGTYFPFLLWAFGVIAMYNIALFFSIILGILMLILGIRHSKKLEIQTEKE